MTLLVAIVLITIFVSATCSLYEAILYSTRRGTLESAKTQQKRGKLALIFIDMKTNISKPIAAILILNTLANTAGASIAGMYASEVLGTALLPVFSILFTIAILFLSEIMPKTLGALHWKTLWPWIVYPLKVIQKLLSPLIYITEKFTKLLTSQTTPKIITEEEILALVHLGAKEGEITHDESRMVRNIIHLEEKRVEEIMTPRKMVFSMDVNLSIKNAFSAARKHVFNRIPVYGNDKENIIGYVLVKDIYTLNILDKGQEKLRSILLNISIVDEKTNCLSLLNNFLKSRKHIAIVKDEFNGLAGLVTLEDLIETALGHEIVDETDKVVDLQAAARGEEKANRGSHAKKKIR
jgi:CBS domain containing-hemolysin-like protein